MILFTNTTKRTSQKREKNWLLSLHLYFLILLVITILSSCGEEFLDRKPLGKETTESFLGNADLANQNFEKMVIAAYESFNFDEGQWGGIGHHGEWMWDIVSDDAQKGGDGPGNQTWMLDWRYWNTSPNNMGPAKSAYIAYNVAKERANTILANIETYKDNLTPENYRRIKGEALFIRAYFYFYGVKMFGSIPYFDRPILPEEFRNPANMEPEEIYQKIEADLTEAVSLLEEKSKWMNLYNVYPEGRATKGAARAILARVITMQIGFGFNNKTWTDVYNVTKNIITSGEYALEPNYATIFEPEGENSSESIFEVQCVNIDQGWGQPGGNIEVIMVSPRLTSGNNRGKNLFDGWGFKCPTPSLSEAFEPGDPRRKCTIIENGDILWEDGNAETDERIDISVQDKCPTFMYSRKYSVPPTNKSSNNQNSNVNKRLCRYAEVLLIHAEAAAHLGKTDEAINMVNQIRARARQSTLPKGSQLMNPGYQNNTFNGNLLPDLNIAGEALLEAIRKERRVELAHEGHRLWDLIRWGKYEEAIKTYINEDYLMAGKDPDGKNSIENYKSHLINGKVPWFLIPEEEILKYGISQNPGY